MWLKSEIREHARTCQFQLRDYLALRHASRRDGAGPTRDTALRELGLVAWRGATLCSRSDVSGHPQLAGLQRAH
jgi:hypothetical protein